MITNIDNKLKVSGIYKINYSNGKIYIGQSISIYARALEHNSKNKYPCDKALKKYDAKIEILEEVKDILKLDEIETKWINFYNATNKEIGYNIVSEGNAAGKKGIRNPNAKLNEAQLKEVINLIQYSTSLSYEDIGKKYGVSKEIIFRISHGISYYNPDLTYPLRDNNHESTKKELSDYFKSKEHLIELKEDLKYNWELSIEKDLVKKYNIPLKILRDINQGRRFKNIGSSYEYPIRKNNIRNINNFKKTDIESILYLLKNTTQSMTQIGNQFGLHRATISRINKGTIYPIKNFSYPARD